MFQFVHANGIAKINGHTLTSFLAQLLYLFDGDDFALTNDRDAPTYLLDIAHDVRTHEDGFAALLLLQQKIVEGALQKWIKTGSWLVQDQYRVVAHKGQHDADLLAHAFGIALQWPLHLYIEAFHQVVQQHRGETLQAREVVDDLLAGHLSWEAHVAGQVADVLV